jgi:hypothetical protein
MTFIAFPGHADASAFPGHAGRGQPLLGWRLVARIDGSALADVLRWRSVARIVMLAVT